MKNKYDTMKKKYDRFIFLATNCPTLADLFLNDLTPLEAATLIFMSERNSIRDHKQDVGDYLLRHYGETPAHGIIKVWSDKA